MLSARVILPPAFNGMPLDSVSANFRALKYVPGDYHGRHKDGTYTDRHDVALSGISLLLYLNDAYEGGRTRFYDSDAADSAYVAVLVPVPADCQPRRGARNNRHQVRHTDGCAVLAAMNAC
jgi:hypothetical protein